IGASLLWYGQNYLIYPSAFPPGSRTEVPKPTDFGIPYQDLELKTSDGIRLRCYLLPQSRSLSPPEATPVRDDAATDDEVSQYLHCCVGGLPCLQFISSRPTVVMFHGNGGNHGHRIPIAKIFFMKMRCNVLMMSYRGYGLSEGSPSEKGFRIDAQAALDYVSSDPIFKQTTIILYGQSIGGAVSIDLASRNPTKINALILENTFTSLPDVIPHALPLLGPFSFLCHQKWDSVSKIPLIPATTPILMLSGLKDELVPKDHMRTLWEAVGLERAKYMEFENGGHNDTCVQTGYWPAVAEFIASLDTPLTREKTNLQ
ncbi:alpha/beta-hydrolase, partial [Tricholoma matsutake]